MTAPPADILLRAEGLVLRRQGRRILDRVSLTLRRGDRALLTGPNGAGKSSLIRAIAGLELLEAGRIQAPPNLGVVLETGGLISGLTVAENLALPLVRARTPAAIMPTAIMLDRIRWALVRFDLAAWEYATADMLTRGQGVRVQIARAALLEPDLLLCDAPLDALDPAAAAEIERLIVRFAETGGAAVLMATNNPDRALGFARQIWRIDQGRLSVA